MGVVFEVRPEVRIRVYMGDNKSSKQSVRRTQEANGHEKRDIVFGEGKAGKSKGFNGFTSGNEGHVGHKKKAAIDGLGE